MIATYHGHRGIVKILLERGADVDVSDCFGKKARDRAKDEVIVKMIEKGVHTYSGGKTMSNKKPPSRPSSPQRSPQNSVQKQLSSTFGSFSKQTSASKGKISTARALNMETTSFLKTQNLASPQSYNKLDKQNSFSSVKFFLLPFIS